uniref:Death-associated protein 1 n=1 Tax=Girardia tigrina TaxID=6162 RepID=A0SIE2_GIRTI|nr:death-associated protein 1 [Girardia tigrina]
MAYYDVKGHPPAAKVGGMRVRMRSRDDSGSEKISADEIKRQEEEYGTEIQATIGAEIIPGVEIDEKKAFPPEAIKAFHDKPRPTHNKPNKPVPHHINQPR